MNYSRNLLAWFGLGIACAVLMVGFSAIRTQSTMEEASHVLREHGIYYSANDNRRSSDMVHMLVAPAGTRPPNRLLPNVITGEFGSTIRVTGHCTEEVINAIRTIRDCRSLILDGSDITDSQLESLGSLNQLQTLSLNSTKITDRGVRVLASFPRLKWVELQGTLITDDSVGPLLLLQDIECLRLGNTLISDEGIRKLTQLQHLRDFGCPTMREETFAFLRQRFPDGGFSTESD